MAVPARSADYFTIKAVNRRYSMSQSKASLITGAAGSAEVMMTRGIAEKTKLERKALHDLCRSVITETTDKDFLKNAHMVSATYFKLVGYRKRLVKERGRFEDDDSFVASEELERNLLATCEELYNALPISHSFRVKDPPPHLQDFATDHKTEAEGKKDDPPKIFGFKEPRVALLDGRSVALWAQWKQTFQQKRFTRIKSCLPNRSLNTYSQVLRRKVPHPTS